MCNSADLVVDEVKGSNAGQRLIRVGATPPATWPCRVRPSIRHQGRM